MHEKVALETQDDIMDRAIHESLEAHQVVTAIRHGRAICRFRQ